MNLIVGANNVGKSALLWCLAAQFGADPHRSLSTLPSRDSGLNRISRVDYTFVLSGDEFRDLLMTAGTGTRHIPWPRAIPYDNNRAREALNHIFGSEIRLHVSLQLAEGGHSLGWTATGYPVTDIGTRPLVNNNNWFLLRVDVNSTGGTFEPLAESQNVTTPPDVGLPIAQLAAGRVYRFAAERLNVGASAHGSNAELAADARNLAEVLNIMQANPMRFSDYARLVTKVFPTVKKVAVRPSGPQQVEIMIWQHDPASERDDLAMPLSKCGTGVGQVLAMLYVAKTSERPRTIIIDEPNSFLHPGAARALIAILREFRQHQYIISTHSPEVISEARAVSLTVLDYQDSQTAVTQYVGESLATVRKALLLVGARLSDVFGYDYVLWTEGPSDAAVFNILIDEWNPISFAVAVCPVRNTSEFDKPTIAQTVEIYTALSHAQALIPPTLGFIFDRDGRTGIEINEALHRTDATIRFLRRQMMENYFLDPDVLAALFNSLVDHVQDITADQVSQWLRGQYGPATQEWRDSCHGKNVIKAFIAHFSSATHIYRERLHLPMLARKQLGIDAGRLSDLRELLIDLNAIPEKG